jgi:hypothetical protein
MDLNEIFPDNSGQWKVSKGQLFYKKYIYLPICRADGDVAFVYLDRRAHKAVIKAVAMLMEAGVEFYCLTPEMANPKGMSDFHEANIAHYLLAHSSEEFFRGFEKIGFDLIKNMTDWAEKEGCFDLIKECYDDAKKRVCRSYYDYYSRKDIFDYPQDIRDAFERLYRDIQISRII